MRRVILLILTLALSLAGCVDDFAEDEEFGPVGETSGTSSGGQDDAGGSTGGPAQDGARVSHEAGPRAPAEVYGDFTMMGQRRAGQMWAGNVAASQYAWAPVSASESHIYWGDPGDWPPTYHERLIREGDWVMLDGWWGNGTYYTVRVTQEQLCDASCSNCTTIATSGRQHYVKWTIPATTYCLRAQGIVTEQFSGKTMIFGHTQAYWPPAPCSNAYYSGQRCIRQWESWWDNHGTPYQRKVDRDQYLAKGIGGGFSVHQYFPTSWQADLRYYWDY